MATRGNRAKAARHRAKSKAGAPAESATETVSA
jgi:predicted RNA-binding Zn ribbon-like protein